MNKQKTKKPDRPPPPGGAQHQRRPHGDKPTVTRPPTTDKHKQRPVTPHENVRYAVIITNVENDFGKLHNAALPYYCGLRADYEETLDVERLVNMGGAQAKGLISATRGCGYAVRCRTETRSAEISFYGPAGADFGPMQLQKQPRPVRVGSSKTGSATAAGSSTHTAASELPSEQEQQGDTTAHLGDGSAKDELAEDAGVQELKETTTATTNALEALALRLRHMRYFEDRLPVHVHLPGHAAGEVLLRIPGDGTAKAEGSPDNEKDAAHTKAKIGEKRLREESDDGGDGVDDATLADEEEEGDAKQRAKMEGGDSTQPRRPRAKKAIVLKQFSKRQKDFVTAVAALSAHVPLRALRRRLHDLPGYMSCWSLYEKHVRVVFRDTDSLFKAKQLLDQFELQAGLRVSLLLSDSLSRRNAEFVQAQEAEEAE
ncbi:hypothetical protein ABL78_1185 [Leptomonas seymouri]|uniref:Uncharacterized protein n=1 Tax=Leptomonas seymouri TaxID=5684 RepID=A0A0N1I7S2_LEPSE|nr:hypothetical protein ABL78_1185 [Leptomonas seymouri]|eukprot:KPI89692.1 hypothetical protein ABL78_1185 [Leptomonas seymouri]